MEADVNPEAIKLWDALRQEYNNFCQLCLTADGYMFQVNWQGGAYNLTVPFNYDGSDIKVKVNEMKTQTHPEAEPKGETVEREQKRPATKSKAKKKTKKAGNRNGAGTSS